MERCGIGKQIGGHLQRNFVRKAREIFKPQGGSIYPRSTSMKIDNAWEIISWVEKKLPCSKPLRCQGFVKSRLLSAVSAERRERCKWKRSREGNTEVKLCEATN